MQTITEPARETPIVRQVDVLVVGGGPAGFVAAAAAARAGARTLLVERYGYLGGLATGGLVLHMIGLGDGQGQRAVGGLPWEIMERLRGIGGLAADAPLRLHVDSELLKVVADAICLEAGVELRLHSWAVGAVVEGRRVRGAIVESKSGRQAILAQVCVDATGDGDLAALAGARYEMGYQRIGLNLKVGGVSREEYQAWAKAHPERLRALRAELRALGGLPLGANTTPQSDVGVYWVNILGLKDRSGAGPEEEGDIHEVFDGQLSTLDVEDLTFAEVELRRRALLSLDFYRRHVPGFQKAYLLAFAAQLGVRESRRIVGQHQLTREEVLADARFPDAIGQAGLGFGDHRLYQIPYGCLVPQDVEGLLVAGRCLSADHWTQQAIRLIPAAMVTGQAAGLAAALAARAGIEPRRVEPRALRQELLSAGALIA